MNGAALAAWWGLPFAGMLLSIAVLPLLAPAAWHRHQGKIAAGWALAFVLPYALLHGAGDSARVAAHVLLDEYLPFIALLTALYTAAGGIYIRGNLHGSPGTNVAILGTGAVLASVMGTTGASMLMIRPLLRANDDRRHNVHVVVFFIFIVGNAAGSLTPLGDPPLFLGYLNGVSFFWTARHLFPETLFLVGSLLVIFWLIDRRLYATEGALRPDPTPDTRGIGIEGAVNLLPLALVVALLLAGLPPLVRDAGLVGVSLLSLAVTPAGVRQKNRFSWAPMVEVAKLFVGIFVTMVPVLAMLKAGSSGAFAGVAQAVTGAGGQPLPWAYFWASGLLSSFLDNAPTYLVFFNLAGGDAALLMTTLAATLAAISGGSVFMGANTYIGNAPNFMVKAIAEDRGVKMPSFFGYMAWSGAVLLPLFVVMTLIWFR